MFKLNKKIVLSIISLCSLASFNMSRSMITPIGPYNFLLNKMIKGVTSKSISGVYRVASWLRRKYRSRQLKQAVKRGDLKKVKELLKYKDIDVNTGTGEFGWSPLFYTLMTNSFGILKELLKHPKIDVNKDHNGQSPIFYACSQGYLDIVKELLKHPKIDVNKVIGSGFFKGSTPLFFVCDNGNVDTLKELLKHPKIDVNKVVGSGFFKGSTPLFYACKKDRLEIAKELLKHPKIDVNKTSKFTRNRGLMTPLFFVCDNGNVDTLKELLKHPKIDINKVDETGYTPLFVACKKNRLEIVKELLKHPKIDVNKANKDGNTPLWWVFFNPSLIFNSSVSFKILKLLLQNSAEIDNKIRIKAKMLKRNIDKNQIRTLVYTDYVTKSNYINLVTKYNREKTEKGKLKFIFDKVNNKYRFKFLVRYAFGRAIQVKTNSTKAVIFFEKLYKVIRKKDMEKIFFVSYTEDLFDFVKAVVGNKKNCFRFDELRLNLILKSINAFKDKLDKTRKNRNFTDVAVKTVYE
ncbi:ankyrin repeat domain-containing protein [Candidatus Dependentiae bacterium]